MKAIILKHIISCNTETSDSQSNDKEQKSKSRNFVFYPSDNPNDLAFSVNLRNIAQHYIHDQNVRNVLTAKANEHLSGVEQYATANGTKHTLDKNIKQASSEWLEKVTGDTDKHKDMNRNVSRLDKFLSRNYTHLLLGNHMAHSGKRSETFHKMVRRI